MFCWVLSATLERVLCQILTNSICHKCFLLESLHAPQTFSTISSIHSDIGHFHSIPSIFSFLVLYILFFASGLLRFNTFPFLSSAPSFLPYFVSVYASPPCTIFLIVTQLATLVSAEVRVAYVSCSEPLLIRSLHSSIANIYSFLHFCFKPTVPRTQCLLHGEILLGREYGLLEMIHFVGPTSAFPLPFPFTFSFCSELEDSRWWICESFDRNSMWSRMQSTSWFTPFLLWEHSCREALFQRVYFRWWT